MTAIALVKNETASQVDAVFIHDREPPEDWVTELARLSPRSEAHGFLMLVWEPGDPWIPVQRWVLYECVTPEWANEEMLAELRGPNPRSEGHMCSVRVPKQFQCLCRHKWESWRGGPCYAITLTQWKLFRRTGLVGRPFWVIQGDVGGHKRFFTRQEAVYQGDAGKPTEPPAPGDLPYAPFDGRVVQKIMRFNRLQQVAGDLRLYRKAMGPEHAKYLEDQDRELRRQIVDWLDVDFAEEEDQYLRAVANDDVTDLMPRSNFDIDAVADDVVEGFIETGNTPDPRTLYDLKYGR